MGVTGGKTEVTLNKAEVIKGGAGVRERGHSFKAKVIAYWLPFRQIGRGHCRVMGTPWYDASGLMLKERFLGKQKVPVLYVCSLEVI